MKVAKIQSSVGFKSNNNKSLGIQNYDFENNYPQKVEEIVRASGTGSACVRTYARFIYGHGFNDTGVAEVIANRRGETLDYVLKQACRDYALYHGFALHVNYNALYRITEIYHIPFEHCRFEEHDKETRHFDKIAVYDDWTGRDPDRKAVKKENIDFIYKFDPDPEAIQRQIEASKPSGATSGWPYYKGQVYYFSGTGDREYPAPIFEAELTNMRSEEGIDNVVGRNVTCNFLPGVIIADVNNEAESEKQFEELQSEFGKYQGDENSNNIFLVQVKSKEEIPITIPISGENYDKEFSVTQSYIPAAIGRAFSQPPILRAENVTTGFSTNEMVNAYNFYNTQTVDERQDVSNVFTQLFQYWRSPGDLTDAVIAPLLYNVGASMSERMGRDLTNDVIEVVANEKLSPKQKVKILTRVYGFEPDEAVDIVFAE